MMITGEELLRGHVGVCEVYHSCNQHWNATAVLAIGVSRL